MATEEAEECLNLGEYSATRTRIEIPRLALLETRICWVDGKLLVYGRTSF